MPIACFLIALVGWGFLWQRQAQEVYGIGQVDALRINVNSPATGLVARMPHHTRLQWNLFDQIDAGDVIAEFDDSEYQAALQRFEFELDTLAGELKRWQASAGEDQSEEFAATLESVVNHELDAIDLARTLAQSESAAFDGQGDEATNPTPPLPAELSTQAREQLDRLRAARASLAIRSTELRVMRQALEIRAPISGTLVGFYCAPGQQVHLGGPIATIAANHGRHIVSYLPEATHYKPEPGMSVVVRSRSVGSKPLESVIEEVGNQLMEIPPRQSTNPTAVVWGLPVRIAMPMDVEFQPGALVDVVFHRHEEE